MLPKVARRRRGMDFLVERSPREVLDRAETHLWLGGFRASLRERTETAALFARTHAPRRGAFKRLLNALVGAPTPVQKIRLLASEAGEGRTRLTVLEWRQGEGPDAWARVGAELERWVVEELGGTGGPTEFPRNGGEGRAVSCTPAAGAAGSGSGKRPTKRSTADLSPSIFRSPERSAPARSRSS